MRLGLPKTAWDGPLVRVPVWSQAAVIPADVKGERVASWFRAAFQSRTALGVLTAAFAVTGLLLVAGGRVLYDEGLLTYGFARWLFLDPAPAFFFQKIKPITSAVFALPSLGGLNAMLAVHVLVAALVAPLIVAVARAMGIRAPNLAALIVLVSPLFLLGAAAGISNVDGVVGTTLFLYLAVSRHRDWLAGVVLGCLPWIRYELAPFALVMWLFMAIVERRRGLSLGVVVFPFLYAVSGAAYHRDLLWLVHFGPTMPAAMPGNPIWAGERIGLDHVFGTQLLVTAAVGFAFAVDPRRLSPIERVLLLYAVISMILLSALPAVRMWNFGASPRYSLQPLPVFALLAARAFDPFVDGPLPSRRLFLVAAVLGTVWLASDGPPAIQAIPILIAYLGAAALASLGWKRTTTIAVAVTACLGLGIQGTQMTTPAYVTPAMTWLNEHAADIRGATIYTNSKLLPFRIAASGALAGTDVRFIAAPDLLWEIDGLSNPDNGQRDALRRLVRTELYGRSVLSDEITPDSIPPGSLFVLYDDPRLAPTLPRAAWAGRLQRIGASDSVTIDRLLPPASARASGVKS